MTLIDRAVMKAFERLEPRTAHAASSQAPTGSVSAANALDAIAGQDTGNGPRRELYLHEPETRLRGIHRAPAARHSWPTANEAETQEQEALPSTKAKRPNSGERVLAEEPPLTSNHQNVDPVINGLLNYELSIQGPRLDDWQMTTQAPTTASPDHPPESPAEPSIDIADPHQVSTAAEEFVEDPTDQVAPPISVFKPAWETDAFLIPDTCQQIQSALQDHVQRAASRLMDDCVAGRPLIRINGVNRSVGQTTVSILLAQALAKTGLRVLLIDGDITKADLAEQLGVDLGGGWTPKLTSLPELAECCVQSISDNFCVLPFDPEETHLREAISMKTELWQALALHFDMMIVDAGVLSSRQIGLPEPLVGAHIIVTDVRTDVSLPGAEFCDSDRVAMHIIENFASTSAVL